MVILNGGYMLKNGYYSLLLSLILALPVQVFTLPSFPTQTLKLKAKIIGENLSSLCSYQNQAAAIALYKQAEFLIALPLLFKAWSNNGSERIHPLPEEIETAVKKMGMKTEDLSFYKSPISCVGAAGSNGSITIDPEFYDKATRQERLMIIGHELTHIRDRHHMKGALAAAAFPLIGLGVTKTGTALLEAGFTKASQSPLLTNYPKVLGVLQTMKDAGKVTLESPLFNFLLTEGAKAMLARHFEKSADLTSAQTLDCADGGVSFFNSYLEKDKNRSWLSCFHPYHLFHTLQEKLGLATHPEHGQRVKYLTGLAKEQYDNQTFETLAKIDYGNN